MNVGDLAPQPVRRPPHDGGVVVGRAARRVAYALEGAIFVTGAAVQWLRDQLGLIASAEEIGALAASVDDTGGRYVVPAFAGLGSPWWDPYARGTLVGLSRGVGRAQLARAVIEAMAFQTRDVVDAMHAAAGQALTELRVDGGASVMDLLLQDAPTCWAYPSSGPRPGNHRPRRRLARRSGRRHLGVVRRPSSRWLARGHLHTGGGAVRSGAAATGPGVGPSNGRRVGNALERGVSARRWPAAGEHRRRRTSGPAGGGRRDPPEATTSGPATAQGASQTSGRARGSEVQGARVGQSPGPGVQLRPAVVHDASECS